MHCFGSMHPGIVLIIKNILPMSNKFRLTLLLLFIGAICISAFIIVEPAKSDTKSESCCKNHQNQDQKPQGCVFKSVMGEDSLDTDFIYPIPEKVKASLSEALSWISKAQLRDGGWGAGSHSQQNEMNPQNVPSDPATTAMVLMALLRNNHTPISGTYSQNLNQGTQFLILSVLKSDPKSNNITLLTGTQPQSKLGANIDVVLTAQYFSNLLDYLQHDPEQKNKVQQCLDICVKKIEQNQNQDGSFKDDGWAGVLQSSYANNALESAEKKGAKVNKEVLVKSRDYQKSNFDTQTGNVKTEKGAGVMLYSVSSTARGSAAETREVKDKVKKAKKEGALRENDEISVENLKKIGYADDQAYKAVTAYQVNEASKVQAVRDDVMSGFGNNGGEEFMSFLQTGEGLIIAKDQEWKLWYDKVSAKLLQIQNDNGSWNGHHCITSPVFCTATCLLILSVGNDIASLQKTTMP